MATYGEGDWIDELLFGEEPSPAQEGAADECWDYGWSQAPCAGGVRPDGAEWAVVRKPIIVFAVMLAVVLAVNLLLMCSSLAAAAPADASTAGYRTCVAKIEKAAAKHKGSFRVKSGKTCYMDACFDDCVLAGRDAGVRGEVRHEYFWRSKTWMEKRGYRFVY